MKSIHPKAWPLVPLQEAITVNTIVITPSAGAL